jgi:hypothetical protein
MERIAQESVTESKLVTDELRRTMEECAQLLVEWKSLTDALAEAGWDFVKLRSDLMQCKPGAGDWTLAPRPGRTSGSAAD